MFIVRASGYLGILVASLGLASQGYADGNIPAKDRDTVEIGMPDSLFQGIPKVLQRAGAGPFLRLMRDNTGIQGSIHFVPDAMTLAAQIDSGKIHLGVFQGHEFAWAKAKYPDLVPIVVTAPMQPIQAFCLVRWDCTAKNIGELQEEKASLPPIHRDYCELFLAKQKAEHMKGKSFAGQIDSVSSVDAIFNVIEGKSGFTVVDCVTLNFFETQHPGPFKNLRILSQSDIFPNACIAYKKNELDAGTVEKFRKALLNAQDLPGGRPMLATWKLKSFSKVPDDYELALKNVLKSYPSPSTVRAIEK